MSDAAPTEAVDGLLLIDKPSGITSHDAVDRVRRALGQRKVGHAGTLDPMATGLLAMGAGRVTRLLRFLGELPKTYEATMRLGIETTTLDADGEVVQRAPVVSTDSEIGEVVAALIGDSMQRPPAYSAVKVGGRRSYEAARAGEPVEVDERPITVAAFDVTGRSGDDVDLRVVCSGGTYVRVLAADVGAALGCGAHLVALRRTAIGHLLVGEATGPDDPTPLPAARAVAHLPTIEVDPEEASAVSNGRVLGPAGIAGPHAVVDRVGRLLAVYEDDGPRSKPLVVLVPA